MKEFFLNLLVTLYVSVTIISLSTSIVIFIDFNNTFQLRDVLYISIPLFFILVSAMPQLLNKISNWDE